MSEIVLYSLGIDIDKGSLKVCLKKKKDYAYGSIECSKI